jgi:hypothetical protein
VSRSWSKWAGLFLIVAATLAARVWFHHQAAPFARAATAFLDDVAAHRLDAAYARTSAALRAAVAPDAFARAATRGNVLTTVKDFDVERLSSSDGRVTASGEAHTDAGKVRLRFRFVDVEKDPPAIDGIDANDQDILPPATRPEPP